MMYTLAPVKFQSVLLTRVQKKLPEGSPSGSFLFLRKQVFTPLLEVQ